MNLTWSQDDLKFREDVKELVSMNLPNDIRNKVFKRQRLINTDYIRWHRILAKKGWGAPTWPVEFGGPGWSPLQRLIFEIECFKGGSPRLLPFGLGMIGPVLMKFGTKAQQDYFLPRIPNVEDWWCQGYSEPGSGSDLASLRTTAIKTGKGYVVNGQKTWTTLAQYADWMFCLVKTDLEAKPQNGISMLLIDLRQPGVTVRPIRTLDGSEEVNEVWFDNVQVPFTNLVGQENKGWTCAKYLLSHERTGIAGIGFCYRELNILKDLARTTLIDHVPAAQSARLREKIIRMEIDILGLEMLLLRVAASSASELTHHASILKIRGSELQQNLTQLQMEVMGVESWPYDRQWLEANVDFSGPGPDFAVAAAAGYVDMRKTTIYGGSTEIQKNIIAKSILSGSI